MPILAGSGTLAQPAGFGAPFMNKAPAPSSARPLADEQPIPQNPAGHTEAAGEVPPGHDQGEGASNVLAAFAKDTGPAADAIRELLAEKDPEDLKAKSSKLIASLPSLLPEDPALAAVIAEAMAAEFGSKPSASADAVANKEGSCTSPNGPAGCKSPTCPGAKDLSTLKDDQGDGLDEVHKSSLLKGHASIDKVLSEKCDVIEAMNDPELGAIDFRWDAHGFGIKHIIERREAFRNNGHPDAITGEDMVRMLPSVIVRGNRTFVGKGLRRDVEIDFKGLHVVLTPSLRGKPTNHWVMTGYDINPEAAGYRK